MRAMIELGASGRTAGVSLLVLAFAWTVAGTAAAKDVAGRKRCFVAGVETYKDEPVYRDRSSGYQRVQVPGAKGERCFWEPLDYQEAAAAAPVPPSMAAPSTSGRHRTARAEPPPDRTADRPQPATADTVSRSAAAEPAPAAAAEPQRIAALPPATHPRPLPETRARPEPEPRTQPARPEPQSYAQPARPEPQPQPQPAARSAPPPAPEPVTPVLQPRGLSSGGASGGGLDLRIQTRPLASGGSISTVSSGPEIGALTQEDQVVPPVGEPMQLPAAHAALASLSPRTDVSGAGRARSEPARRPAAEPVAERPAPQPEPRRTAAAPQRETSGSRNGSSEGSFVQLGSVTSYQKAKQFWTDVTGRYPEVLAGLSPDIVEADIPGKGIYYRVRVGPFDSDEANAVCSRLKRLDGNCLVVGR
jgi:hypothetical protein